MCKYTKKNSCSHKKRLPCPFTWFTCVHPLPRLSSFPANLNENFWIRGCDERGLLQAEWSNISNFTANDAGANCMQFKSIQSCQSRWTSAGNLIVMSCKVQGGGDCFYVILCFCFVSLNFCYLMFSAQNWGGWGGNRLSAGLRHNNIDKLQRFKSRIKIYIYRTPHLSKMLFFVMFIQCSYSRC